MRTAAAAAVAALALLALAAPHGAFAHTARCKHAALPDIGTSATRRQDADGITRTSGTNCRDYAGLPCSLCCDGICCEYFNGTDASNFPEQHWIPLRFAVIASTNTTYDSLVQRRVTENLRTMNQHFAVHNVWFYAAAIDSYNDARMVASCNTNPCDSNPDCDYKTYTLPRVRGDTTREILVVVCDDLPYLGEAPLPWSNVESSVEQYIQVTSASVGNNQLNGLSFLGYTLVHEMGHYFGLFHTFDKPGQCDIVGDWVDDTPSSGVAATEDTACDAALDTCPGNAGLDPVSNFMNYARDACMTEFTAGQRTRMNQALRRYRPLLLAATRVPSGACPATATTLQECSCTNGASQLARCASGTPQPAGATTPLPPATVTDSGAPSPAGTTVLPPAGTDPVGSGSAQLAVAGITAATTLVLGWLAL